MSSISPDHPRWSRIRSIAFIGWLVTIFLYSSLPGGKRPELEGPYTDKWVHMLVYFILGALLFRWMLCWRRPEPSRRWRRFGLVVLIAFVYSLTDEIHQYLVPGRVCDLADVVADTLGGVLAGTLCLLPWKWQLRLGHLRWNVETSSAGASGILGRKTAPEAASSGKNDQTTAPLDIVDACREAEKTLASASADPTC